MARTKARDELQPIAENRKARHDYFVEETYEAGIVLVGSEVKSCRAGRVNLRDAYAQIKDGEIYLYGCHISPYEQANLFNHEPLRPRKLLMHKAEIRAACTARSARRVSRWSRCGYTLRRVRSRSNWPWRRASGPSTSAKTSPPARRNGRWPGPCEASTTTDPPALARAGWPGSNTGAK